jgi:2-dehydro-3-deoxygluconokinase
MPRSAGGVEVVTLGECLISLVADSVGPLAAADRFRRFVAGAEANVAVGLARLGHSVGYVGRVGGDGFGDVIRRQLRGEGVVVDHLTTEPGASTGVMIRELRGVGPADVLYLRSRSAGSALSDMDVRAASALFVGARWLHLTGITPALSTSAAAAVDVALELAAEHEMTVSLDLNLRRKLWSDEEAAPVLRRLASRSDVVLGGLDEALVVTGLENVFPAEAAAALRSLGPSTAVVKLGSAGAVAIGPDGVVAERAAVPVATVLDPVGAGDGFTAAYIAARLEGNDEMAALAWATAAGAAAVAAIGDLTGLPTRAQLDRLLDQTVGSDDRIDTLR